MTMFSPLSHRLRRFRSEDEGSVTIEMLLILPVVLWAFLATFVFFDAFSSRTAAERAAYTISDSIGRQQNSALTPDDLDSYNRIFSYLARNQPNTRLRVSSIIWNPVDEEYNVVWSYATNDGTPLTTETLTPELIARLPVLERADGQQSRESVFLTETSVGFVPVLESLPLVGLVLRPQVLSKQIVSRPRFSPQLRFDDGTGVIGTTFPTCDDPGVICGTEDPDLDDGT
jgi:Flp pilus assembly protein TadG